jgi:hypothetical protein
MREQGGERENAAAVEDLQPGTNIAPHCSDPAPTHLDLAQFGDDLL